MVSSRIWATGSLPFHDPLRKWRYGRHNTIFEILSCKKASGSSQDDDTNPWPQNGNIEFNLLQRLLNFYRV